MPYLIVSDLHANREALESVIQDAAGLYDQIICLGDVVGYGADPNQTVEWVRSNTNAAIRGNHDRMSVDQESLEDYNPAAQRSTEWTRGALTSDSVQFLKNLARGPLRINGFDMVHGSPLDEDQYLIHPGDVAPQREVLDTHVTFFGHTHVQGGFLITRGRVRRIMPQWSPDRFVVIEPDHYYLLNPGSVGQPRDMDPRAAYAIYTPEDRIVEFRRVRYDVATAAGKILEAGLPSILAARLYEGA